MNVFILSLLSGLLLWPAIGVAQLYKWTDEQGNFHITDTPPPFIEKKSAPASTPKHATVPVTRPEQSQAGGHSLPGSMVAPASTKDAVVQPPLAGLSADQATLTSAWQTFEGTKASAKAPVQRWKDEQGLDHVGDVVPVAKHGEEMAGKSEGASVSRTAIGVKKRTTAASRTRHRAAH